MFAQLRAMRNGLFIIIIYIQRSDLDSRGFVHSHLTMPTWLCMEFNSPVRYIQLVQLDSF